MELCAITTNTLLLGDDCVLGMEPDAEDTQSHEKAFTRGLSSSWKDRK